MPEETSCLPDFKSETRSKLKKNYAARWRADVVDILTPRLSSEDWLSSRELLMPEAAQDATAMLFLGQKGRLSLVQLQSAYDFLCQLSHWVKWLANTNWWLLWVRRVKNPFACTKTWIDKVTTVALFTVNITHFHRRKPGSYQHISQSNCVPIQVKDGWVYFHFTSESWLSYICIILSVSLRPGKHWIFWWHD